MNNKCYLSIIPEAYNKKPNINRILKCITSFNENASNNLFVLLDSIRIYAKSIRMTNITEKLRYFDGDIGMYYYQMKKYYNLLKQYNLKIRIKNICEIGFQLGVGAITLIKSVSHDVNYYGFDYGNIYSREAYKLISKHFEMKMMWGDSKITVPEFYKSMQSFDKCDVIHIDGCHNQDSIFNDIINMKNISHPHSLLLLDDVYIDSIAILNATNLKLIGNIKCYRWKPYCIAEYS